MTGKLRLEYGGPFYHVLNRGGRRIPIFQTDRALFRVTLTEICQKTVCQCDAQKLKPARRLRQETTTTLQWIANWLVNARDRFLGEPVAGAQRKQ